MSRLDSAIRRLEAQRAVIGRALELVAGRPGAVLELGLGNGRTYDHLREHAGDREIYVFDRQVAAHPDCVPDDAHLFLGDFAETLPTALARLGPHSVALVHADIGTGEEAASRALARQLAPLLAPIVTRGGIVAADQPMDSVSWARLALPEGVREGRYHLYRA